MKPITTTIFFLLIIHFLAFSQDKPEQQVKPVCKIHITTLGENGLRGLLLFTNDSSVIVYPGSRKEWNKGKKYSAVVFNSSRMKRITLKKNNRALKGMTMGSVIGLLPMLAGSKDGDKSGLQELTKLTVPVGGITGALFGLNEQKSFQINGSLILFNEFKKSIK
jgi:hypothetical protein